jgi:SAM-dependent methyltransferase
VHESLVELLICPTCGGTLDWDVTARAGEEIVEAVATCTGCRSSYATLGGIGGFVAGSDAADLWREAESGLARYLAENPDVERALLGRELLELGPADRFFRAYVLEERGDIEGAREAEEAALQALYPSEQRACHRRQLDYITNEARGAPAPVVDIASGRGRLAELLARQLDVLVVATDVSPVVLRRTLRALDFLGLAGRVSFVALDARSTPFRAGSVGLLTSNVGLQNVERPGTLLQELRRITAGRLLAASQLFPPEDRVNRRAAEAAGFAPLAYRESALDAFEAAGWRMVIANSCLAHARPTPESELIPGARIDAFPVAETTAEWCVLDAR